MRPCQKCNAPVGNADKVCPQCGAEQQLTVGLKKASEQAIDSHEPEPEELHWFWEILGSGLFPIAGDPQGCAVIGGILFVGLLYLMYSLNPVATGIFIGICVIGVFVIAAMMNGG